MPGARDSDGPPDGPVDLPGRWGASDVSIVDAGDPGRFDAVVVSRFGRTPTPDLRWRLDDAFSAATALVHLGVRRPPRRRNHRARDEVRSLNWWIEQIEGVAARHPGVHWQLVYADGDRTEIRHGGRHLGERPPRIWVLTDDRPGNTSQSTGLAQALGWPTTIKRLRFGAFARLHNRVLGPTRIGVRRRASSDLRPPWPDIVIAAGRRSAPVAQWIRDRNFGATRLVHMGRKGGDAADRFDLVITPSYGHLDPHPRRLITSAPLNHVTDDRVERAARRFVERFGEPKRPCVAVLVGGWSGQYQFDVETARRLGERVMALSRRIGGSIVATTSRRAKDRPSEAFCAAVAGADHVYRWSAPDEDDNPYLAYLGLADAFVITGDSESMLSEAASRGRPVYVYPLPVRPSFQWLRRGRDWVYARAHTRLETQRGLDYLCARWIDRGFVRPTRDLRALHEGLIDEGVAHDFGDPFETRRCRALANEQKAVRRVCRLMGHEVIER